MKRTKEKLGRHNKLSSISFKTNTMMSYLASRSLLNDSSWMRIFLRIPDVRGQKNWTPRRVENVLMVVEWEELRALCDRMSAENKTWFRISKADRPEDAGSPLVAVFRRYSLLRTVGDGDDARKVDRKAASFANHKWLSCLPNARPLIFDTVILL